MPEPTTRMRRHPAMRKLKAKILMTYQRMMKSLLAMMKLCNLKNQTKMFSLKKDQDKRIASSMTAMMMMVITTITRMMSLSSFGLVLAEHSMWSIMKISNSFM